MADDKKKNKKKKKGEEEDELTPEEFFDDVMEGLGTLAPPPFGAFAKAIPWDQIFVFIQEGVEAKKERDIWRTIGKTWRVVGRNKDILINKLWEFNGKVGDARKWKNALKPVLVELQMYLGQAEDAMEDGDKDEARAKLEMVSNSLRTLRERLEKLQKK